MKSLKQQTLAWLLAGAIGLTVSPTMLAAQETKGGAATPTTTAGSGNLYKTTISQETKGELKPDDARQISVLGSRILTHIHNAARFLGEEKADQARTELEHAQTLARVVREMLPVTVVLTRTIDAQGKEVYRYEDRVQEDQIPIVEGLINVAVVEPIVEAKKEQASLKGLQLADADLIHTAVLLNLDYVESKIHQALAKLKEPDKAQSELMAAASIGVRFTTHEEDHPLVNIQAALRLAEQQVREGKPEGARANLELARVQLEAYRTLVGEAAAKGAADLEKEIAALQDKTGEPGAGDKIRGIWNRVTEWFKPEPGRAQQITEQTEGSKTRENAK
jgi:hypothetical protein